MLIPPLPEGTPHRGEGICLVDTSDPEQIWDSLNCEHPAPEAHGPQVEVLRSTESYLRTGRFSTDEMIDWLTVNVTAALTTDGFPLVRAVGEMTWALRAF